MTQRTEDDILMDFLKTYQPNVPPPSETLENRLMAQIEPPKGSKKRTSHRRLRKLRKAIAFGGLSVLATSLTLSWAMLQRRQISPQMGISPEEIETFMVEGWQETMGDTLEASSSRSASPNWLLLGDSEVEWTNQVK